MCDLCVENLRVFSHERKYYTRKELARHRKTGDPDETSHRGHPICTFCDQRFVDDDDLHMHLRREHFYCHFCDPSGFSHFYGEYNDLRDHFISKHFLCKECDSQEEKFTNAFRSEIDLQAHIAQFHSQNMSKSDLKKAKTISLDHFIRQRSGQILDNGQQSKRQMKRDQRRHNNQNDHNSDNSDDSDEASGAVAAVAQPPRPEDFPSLSSNAVTSSPATAKQNNGKETKKSNKKSNTYSVYLSKNPKLNTGNAEEFPALPGGSASANIMTSNTITYNKLTKQQKPSTSSKSQTDLRKNINVINSSLIPNETVKTKSNKPLIMNKEEFPSLPITKKKTRTSTQSSTEVKQKSSSVASNNDKTIEWNAGNTSHNGNPKKDKIGNTSQQKNNSMPNIEEFPSLEIKPKKSSSTLSKAETKTFSQPQTTNPPPGLPSVKKKPTNLSLSSVAQQVITTSGDPQSSNLNSNDYSYINPIDFNERNQALVKQVESVLSDRSKFLLFKEASKQFRQSFMTGDQYYSKCIEIFGKKNFSTIFAELLVLLPDIGKQNELLSAQQTDVKSSKGAIPKGFRQLNDSNSNEFVVCDKCRQIMIPKDQSHHMSAHSL